MEDCGGVRASHKSWRRLAKKERRRRLRREAAREREEDEVRLRAALERSAEYSNWVEEQKREEKERENREKEEHDERETMWLEEEVRAQKEWQALQERKARAKQQQLEQEAKVRQEFEVKQAEVRRKREEEQKRRDEEIKRQEELYKQIDDYIDEGIETPEVLREVIESQPGKELCPFFTKTGACRYGDTCSRNHRRVCLSNVILVPGFYSHFSLEKNSAEYDTDIALEFENSETRQHFREFYKDVVPELESFGRIKTLKYCCNTEVHLRGNLYVEYFTEREAARALRKLRGRWYAGRQLNCEFANLKSWRSAVCGMAKCPKGRACNFLHTFKNPHDEYDIRSPPRWAKAATGGASGNQDSTSNSKRSERRSKSKWEESMRSDNGESRNWRWSESPEPEVVQRSSDNSERYRRKNEDRSHNRKRSHEVRHEDSSRRRTKSEKRLDTPERHRRTDSSSRSSKRGSEKLTIEESNGNELSDDDRSSAKGRRDASRKRKHEENGESREESKAEARRKRRHMRNKEEEEKSGRSKEKGDSRKQRKKRLQDHEGSVDSKVSTERSIDEEKVSRRRKKLSRVAKSKWDREDAASSSDSPNTSDSDNSRDNINVKRSKRFRKRRRRTSETVDEWATTESESDNQNDEAQ